MTPSKHLRRDERGAALLEFALVFGIFVFVLYGLIAFGMILALKQSVTHGATEGARAAIGIAAGDTSPANGIDDREDAARARVKSALNWLTTAQQNATLVDVSFPATGSGAGQCPTTCIKVVIDYPYNTNPLIPAAPGLGLVTPKDLTSTAIVALS